MGGIIEMILRIVERVDVEIDLDPIALLLLLDASHHCVTLNAGSAPRLENSITRGFRGEEEDAAVSDGGGCSCFPAFLIHFHLALGW